jgi:hypothetical protein
MTYSQGSTWSRPSKSERRDRRKVRAAFDAERLIDICERGQDDFTGYAKYVELAPHHNGDPRFYYHADHGSNVLAVAHLDHVQDDGKCSVVEANAGLLAVSGALDDRLGAYVILELLPALGIQFDILLTTDEERGGSTAADFDTDKQYDWIIEFDRGGTDVVMYDFETAATQKAVEDAGADVGLGSFSDICCLEHLGCAAFNWGVGYYDYHGPRAHAWLEDTFLMVARFLKFHRMNEGRYFEHEYDPRQGWGSSSDTWDEGDWDAYFERKYGKPTSELSICEDCDEVYDECDGHQCELGPYMKAKLAEEALDDGSWAPEDDVRSAGGYMADLADIRRKHDERLAALGDAMSDLASAVEKARFDAEVARSSAIVQALGNEDDDFMARVQAIKDQAVADIAESGGDAAS